MNRYVFAFLLCYYVSGVAYSAWDGPVIVLSGMWGSASNEFGRTYSETGIPGADDFPILSGVFTEGDVLVNDHVNNRLCVYSGDGVLKTEIPTSGMGGRAYVVGQNIAFVSIDYSVSIYDVHGDKLTTFKGPGYAFARAVNGKLFLRVNSEKKWYIYDSAGVLLEKTELWPSEIGKVKTIAVWDSNDVEYKQHWVHFEDRDWVILSNESDYGYRDYVRDAAGYLYTLRKGYRYNACGRVTGRVSYVDTWRKVYQGVESLGVDPVYSLGGQHDNPFVSETGEYYVGYSTENGFSVLKWAWVEHPDDPNVGPMPPEKFIATPTQDGTKMKWWSSLDDPGCVTGYAIERATFADGPFTVIHITDKGVEKYTDKNVEPDTTYYYRIQALSIVEGSEYTPVISVAYLP